jgi:succinate dehydrogenase/fumarate reductase flavoprotein subunit
VTQTVSVVVAGFGAAGAAAAITARRLGGDVLVLEKQAADGHTPSTKMSGGLIMMLADAIAGADYLDACAGGMVPRAVSAAWAQRASRLRGWLAELAPDLELTQVGGAEQDDLPGAATVQVFQPGSSTRRLDPASGAGRAVHSALAAAADRAGVRVQYGAAAARLHRDGNGRLSAVELANGDLIRTRAVILACGGFEFDEQMKRDYLPAYPMHFYGNPGNTGDGLRMAQSVGADLWHMNQMVGRAIGHFTRADGSPINFLIAIDPPGYVITDRDGRRFADESAQAALLHGFYYELLYFDHRRGEYPRVPCYWFFDESRRVAGPLTQVHSGANGVGLYTWSADNAAEIATGWICSGDTVEAAARAAGVRDPVAAAATVREYNAACARGADPFGRPVDTMLPLEHPPFYCVPLWPGGSNTSGGPRRDELARVLDVYGTPIPGLFTAGELGQPMGLRYPADGSNLSEALCFGQIAAEHALRV